MYLYLQSGEHAKLAPQPSRRTLLEVVRGSELCRRREWPITSESV
jgi:hypothetical protein